MLLKLTVKLWQTPTCLKLLPLAESWHILMSPSYTFLIFYQHSFRSCFLFMRIQFNPINSETSSDYTHTNYHQHSSGSAWVSSRIKPIFQSVIVKVCDPLSGSSLNQLTVLINHFASGRVLWNIVCLTGLNFRTTITVWLDAGRLALTVGENHSQISMQGSTWAAGLL